MNRKRGHASEPTRSAVAAVEALAVLVAARFYENESERKHSALSPTRVRESSQPGITRSASSMPLPLTIGTFPGARGQGGSLEDAAARLAELLSRTLDSAPSDWRRVIIERAVEAYPE